METSGGDLIGTVIDRFAVVKGLGTGTMGHVFEAEHVESKARVALKVLHPHHQGSEAAARFLREGKTLGLFRHRNIVELLEVGRTEDGTLFLATELVRGRSLRDLMKDGAIEPRRVLAIARQVLDALGAAHALGVVHRDVKPENIMLADGGTDDGTDLVKVLDFGVAKLLGDTPALLGEANLTQVGLSVFGSPDYIAPETALGKPVDARTDLYSVGAILYEALAGKPLYDADDPQELLRHQILTPAEPLAKRAPARTFTPQLEFLVAEALAKDPERRFRSAAEMIAALDAAMVSLDSASLTIPSHLIPAMPTEVTPIVTAPPAPPAPPAAPARSPQRRVKQTSGLFPVRAKQRSGIDVDKISAWARRHRMAIVAGAGTFAVIAIVAVLLSGGGDADRSPGSKGDGASFLALGHERFAAGKRVDALSAYERALRATPSLASSDELRENLAKVLDGKDTAAAILALELYATKLGAEGRVAVLDAAATARHSDVRHRAVSIAERDGFDDKLDRVESYSLDLAQAGTCDERKIAIEKLAGANDKRAIAALERAKAHKCVEKAATDAIARLEGGS